MCVVSLGGADSKRVATQGQQGKAQPSALGQNLNSVHQKGPSFTSQFLSSVSLQPHQTSTLPAGGSTLRRLQMIISRIRAPDTHTYHTTHTHTHNTQHTPGVKPFDFNEPSPDDMVLEKRKQAFKQKKSTRITHVVACTRG